MRVYIYFETFLSLFFLAGGKAPPAMEEEGVVHSLSAAVSHSQM